MENSKKKKSELTILDEKINELIAELRFWDGIEIEDIQNAVEDSLMKYNLYDIERAFHDKRVEKGCQ